MTHKYWTCLGGNQVARIDSQRNSRQLGKMPVRRSGKHEWITAPPKYTSILFTSRQVYAEATAELYRNNHFDFICTSTLEVFVGNIGNCIQHLSHIKLDYYNYFTSSARLAFRLLKAAKGLKEIHVQIRHWTRRLHRHDEPNYDRIIADCIPLLVFLRKYNKAHARFTSALGILHFELFGLCNECEPVDVNPRHHTRSRNSCEHTSESNRILRKETRTAVARYFRKGP